MNGLCLALCLSALTCPATVAQDKPAAMSDREDRELAARAAEMPQLEDFRGGAAWLFISVIAVAFVVIIVLTSPPDIHIGNPFGS